MNPRCCICQRPLRSPRWAWLWWLLPSPPFCRECKAAVKAGPEAVRARINLMGAAPDQAWLDANPVRTPPFSDDIDVFPDEQPW